MITRYIEKEIIKRNLERRAHFWVMRGLSLLIIIMVILSIFTSISDDILALIMMIKVLVIPLLSLVFYAQKKEGKFKNNCKEAVLAIFTGKNTKEQIEKDDISNIKEILIENKLTSKDKIKQLINYFEKKLLKKIDFQLTTFLISLLIPLFLTITIFMIESQETMDLSVSLMLIGATIGGAILIIAVVSILWNFIIYVFFIGNTRNKIIYDVLNEILLMHDLENDKTEIEAIEIDAEERYKEYCIVTDNHEELETNLVEEQVD